MDLHLCKFEYGQKIRRKVEEQSSDVSEIKSRKSGREKEHTDECMSASLRLEPTEILFDDFELHTIYKKKVRLRNCSKRKIPFFFKYPKKSPFTLRPTSDVQFLAPGMYLDFQVTYCPEIYHNYSIDIEFSTSGGCKAVLKVTSFRKPPHLRVYLFRSMNNILQYKCQGVTTEFWDRRCTELKDSIDFGHCFIGNSNFFSLLIGNVANRGRFFILTEEEWIFGTVNKIEHTLQFMKDPFKIFPSYITVERDEVAEICVIFTPKASGLHVEKLYLISDSNTTKAIEIMGDGLFFSRSMIEIHLRSRHFQKINEIADEDVLSLELEGKRRIYLGRIANRSSNKLTFTVNNRSVMSFNFYWMYRKNDDDSNSHILDPKYIHVINDNHYCLSPYTTQDFEADIIPEVDHEGHYCVIIGFYIENIPEIALQEGEDFTVRKDEENIKFLDIQLSELEIGCDIYFEEVVEKIERPPVEICACPKPSVRTESKLKFSTEMMDFGVIPIGLKLTRKLCIFNMTNEKIDWVIREIIYDIDVRPSMYVATNSFIKVSKGTLTDKKYGLTYHIDSKKPIRWLSFLLLFIQQPNGEMVMDDMCMVTYEVVDWDIRIFSDVSNFPIVCSLKLHYVGKPYKWRFFIKNYTPITGCFWLFPPIGEDVHKMDLNFQPKFGLIRPGEKIKIIVNVVPREIGIIENIAVPCFISKSSPPIMIRILAAVDDVNVYFYIPSREGLYDKIIWPPKVLNEVDFQQMNSAEPVSGDYEYDYIYEGETEEEFKNFQPNFPSPNSSSSDMTQSYNCSDDTIMSGSPSDSSDSRIVPLVEFLQERCQNDFMRQDYVVEIRDVPLNKPVKFSFLIENVTPIEANFSIETTNFNPCIEADMSIVGYIAHIYPTTVHSSWRKVCDKHGIVILVDVERGSLNYGDVMEINVWIYATTWGIYTEEIIVNINNICPFYFDAIVEVKGLPVDFPIARNTIRKYATLRFGHIPYMSDRVTRSLHLKNTSCIPLNVQWFLFDASNNSDGTEHFNVILDMINKDIRSSDSEIRLFLSNKDYGEQDIKFMQVFPRSIELAPDENASVEVAMNPKHFPVNLNDTNLTCYLIGYIFVKEEHKIQPNLFYRTSAEDLKPLHVEIVATIYDNATTEIGPDLWPTENFSICNCHCGCQKSV